MIVFLLTKKKIGIIMIIMIYYSYRLTIFVFDNMYFTIMGNIEG